MKRPWLVLSFAIVAACAGNVASQGVPPTCNDSVDVIPSGAPYGCAAGAVATVSLLPSADAPPFNPHVLVVCHCGGASASASP